MLFAFVVSQCDPSDAKLESEIVNVNGLLQPCATAPKPGQKSFYDFGSEGCGFESLRMRQFSGRIPRLPAAEKYFLINP